MHVTGLEEDYAPWRSLALPTPHPRCALATLKAHLEPTTPLDIFVFVRPKFLAHGGALLPDCLQKPGIYALPLKEEVRW